MLFPPREVGEAKGSEAASKVVAEMGVGPPRWSGSEREMDTREGRRGAYHDEMGERADDGDIMTRWESGGGRGNAQSGEEAPTGAGQSNQAERAIHRPGNERGRGARWAEARTKDLILRPVHASWAGSGREYDLDAAPHLWTRHLGRGATADRERTRGLEERLARMKHGLGGPRMAWPLRVGTYVPRSGGGGGLSRVCFVSLGTYIRIRVGRKCHGLGYG